MKNKNETKVETIKPYDNQFSKWQTFLTCCQNTRLKTEAKKAPK